MAGIEGFGVAARSRPGVDARGPSRAWVGPDERSALAPADAVVLAVSHEDYRKEGWPPVNPAKGGGGLVSDVRGCLDETCPEEINAGGSDGA